MKEILDVIHKTIYQFLDICGDDEEVSMSDKDKLLLEVNKAICNNLKELGQEPCEDAISRQAYIERFRKWAYSEYGRKIDNEALAIRVAMSLPPVTPEQKTGHWIPVHERPPEEQDEYMITWTTSLELLNNQGFIGIAEYELTEEFDHENNRFKGEWLLDDNIKNYPDVKVTAWMPLLKPYEPQGGCE